MYFRSANGEFKVSLGTRREDWSGSVNFQVAICKLRVKDFHWRYQRVASL